MTPAVATPSSRICAVRALHRLSSTGYALELERDGLAFRAGQLINLNLPGGDPLDERSYTVCSGERDPYLQVLFREIPHGNLTPGLARLTPGDPVAVSGPFGEFTVRDRHHPSWFIATGTGIAPARAYVRSDAASRLTVVHGVRAAEDLFYREELLQHAQAYVACVSGGDGGDVRGRVTDWLANAKVPADGHFYLCGANEMIYEVRDRLEDRGVPPEHVFTEAYYYRADD